MFWMDKMICFIKKKEFYFLRVCYFLLRAHSMSVGVHKSFPS